MTPSRRRLAKVALVLVVVAAGAVWVSRGADGPADPTLLPAAGRAPVDGFGQIGFRIEGAESSSAARCALLARTVEQRAQGLMHRRDLAGHDGMLFEFETESTGDFWMKDTPLPLSIAWFDSSGRFVSASDMQPCLNQPECPTYPPTGPYRYALEVPRGGLPSLGIGPGSRLVVTGPCSG